MPNRRLTTDANDVKALVLLWAMIEDYDVLFVLAEISHFSGTAVLIYKLLRVKSCAGLSLKTQELTAIFLAARLYCSFLMEFDVHTFLDLITLASTVWVIYTMRVTLKQTYTKELDSMKIYYVLIPCALLSLIAHPGTRHWIVNRVVWAFCVYLEAVSVLPQLRLMQNSKMVERVTSHYVFALGVSRFLSCAHWIFQLINGSSYLFKTLGSGLWPPMVLISEIVQTFILGDFCYYYVKSAIEGTGVMQLPTGVV